MPIFTPYDAETEFGLTHEDTTEPQTDGLEEEFEAVFC